MGKLLQQPNMYADFEFLAFWQTQYNNMNAVNLFFAWIKVPWDSLLLLSLRALILLSSILISFSLSVFLSSSLITWFNMVLPLISLLPLVNINKKNYCN